MKESSEPFSTIATELARLKCPFCSQGKLGLLLRCDLHADRCLFLAQCESCHMQYLVDMDTAALKDQAGSPQGALTGVSCPRCGSPDCTVKFQCTVASRRCAYEVVCPICQDPQVRPRSAV